MSGDVIWHKGLPLKVEVDVGECPFCVKPVGILGNWFAIIFGTEFHNCDYSNVQEASLNYKSTKRIK